MKFTIVGCALGSILSFGFAAAQTLTINTPSSVTQCQPVLLSWTDTLAPYYVYILPGSTLINPYETLSPVDTTSVTWLCDLGTGTTVTFAVKDGHGAIQYTGVNSVISSSNTTCIGTNAVIQASIAAQSSASVASVGTTSQSASATSAGASSTASASAGSSASNAVSSASASATGVASSGASTSVRTFKSIGIVLGLSAGVVGGALLL
ncbi:hypothetical protein [Phaffia rhodozyma]|uniref:Uncharacterized protein n=1 Tax=Phaffia rhodozyma TaxID=264483 RepID=A0A0F7SQ54_PHARH|nr:hypothetical protein [Phaffia rhodozyma]